MSLFQICYGPEIGAILQSVQKYPGIHKEDLINKYQYQPEGDVSSLIDAALHFLLDLQSIQIDNLKNIWPLENKRLKEIDFLTRLRVIGDTNNSSNSNYIFSAMYYRLFVIPNQLYIKDLYYEANLSFEKVSISQEKVNAWKRIMEYFGLGFRVYGGFYALPHSKLMESIIQEVSSWEGPLELFFEKKINPIIPCVYNGTVFNGILYAILNLSKDRVIKLSKKQDLPYLSYGEKKEWNWIELRGEKRDTVYYN